MFKKFFTRWNLSKWIDQIVNKKIRRPYYFSETVPKSLQSDSEKIKKDFYQAQNIQKLTRKNYKKIVRKSKKDVIAVRFQACGSNCTEKIDLMK